MKKIFYLILIIISLLLVTVFVQASTTPAKNPSSAKACAICHYRWVDTFFIEGKGSDLVGYQSEKVVATPEMCFSCHDGSVKDSRTRVSNDSGHKTNVPPPSHMKIPETFPLDDDGKIQCATCHTAHGVPSGTGARDTIFLRTSNKDSAMCRQCHPNANGGIETGNHPLDSTKQAIPASLSALGAAAGHKKNQIICESCHTAHGSPYESLLVKGTGNSGLCLDCHQDKEMFTADGQKKPSHIINVAPQKVKIPEKLIEKGAKLGDKGVITCLTCHKVHDNDRGQPSLLVQKDNQSSLCLTCHTDKRNLANTKHNLQHSKPAERNQAGQTVSEAGVCSACHLPHASARKLSGQKDFTTQLCLSCHGQGNMAERVNLTGNTHPLIVNPFEKKNTKDALGAVNIANKVLGLPLFNKFGVQDKNGKMTCATCHDPHGSPADSVTVTAGTLGKADKSTLFLRKQSPDICRECHNHKFDIAESKHDLRKTAPDAKNALNQSLAESGLCGSCHLVHGSKKGFLWARQTAVVNENKNVQDMCYSCHNEKGIAKKKVHHGYSHPIDVPPAKKGLRTNLPLFDKNGKLSDGGVMTCHTCHDPHNWKADSSSGEKKQNDKGDKKATSFLRKQSPDICRDCHNDKFLIVNSKHDLEKVVPSEKNILGETPKDSGLCGTCHLMHNARLPNLWARKMPTEKKSTPEQLCLGCHSENGPAAKKILKGYSHPINIAPGEKGLKTDLPLFTSNAISAKNGVMTCLTCHDPHRWDPQKKAVKNHFDIEGNAQNSFLRIGNSPSPKLCENCHPDKTYIEKTDHDLIITAPTSKNILNQTPAESGTCGVCHLVHNSKNQIKLWAQGFGGGDGIMDTMCTTCHSKNGTAKDKVPKISTHPVSKIVNLERDYKDRRSSIPLFHQTTGEPVRTGEISCPSCHNVHQWNPDSNRKGQGANGEGNATSSFLRSRSSILKCKDCHSVDALFKFKFFHDPDKRKK